MQKEDLKREDYNYDKNPELLALAKSGDVDAMNELSIAVLKFLSYLFYPLSCL